MAAPTTAYTGKRLNDKVDAVVVDHQYAKVEPDIAMMKLRFYFDDVIATSDGGAGVIGLCQVDGANYKMHAPARRGSLNKFRETVSGNGVWKRYQAFRDGGLNTLGVILEGLGRSVGGKIVVHGVFISSWYNTTTSYGVMWRVTGDTPWQTINGGTWPALNGTDGDGVIKSFIIEPSYGNSVEFKYFLENEEGRFETITPQTVGNTYAMEARYGTTLALANDNMNIENVFMNLEGQPSGSSGGELGSFVTTTRYTGPPAVQPTNTNVAPGYYLDVNNPSYMRVELYKGRTIITQFGYIDEALGQSKVRWVMRGPAPTARESILMGRILISSSNGTFDSNSVFSTSTTGQVNLTPGWYMTDDQHPAFYEVETLGGVSKLKRVVEENEPPVPPQEYNFTDPSTNRVFIYRREPDYELDVPFWKNVCINLGDYMADGMNYNAVTLKRNIVNNKYYEFRDGAPASMNGTILAQGLYFTGAKAANNAYKGEQWENGTLLSTGDCTAGWTV